MKAVASAPVPASGALSRAVEIGRRAAWLGFDWATARQVRAKVVEELAEVDAAIDKSATQACAVADVVGAAPPAPEIVEELGDLLFAIANWGRHLRVNPEEALAAASAKFERRFGWITARVRERGLEPEALSAAQWDELWRDAKSAVG